MADEEWGFRMTELTTLDGTWQEEAIRRLDTVVAALGQRILRPSYPLPAALLVARVRESPDVPVVIRALARGSLASPAS